MTLHATCHVLPHGPVQLSLDAAVHTLSCDDAYQLTDHLAEVIYLHRRDGRPEEQPVRVVVAGTEHHLDLDDAHQLTDRILGAIHAAAVAAADARDTADPAPHPATPANPDDVCRADDKPAPIRGRAPVPPRVRADQHLDHARTMLAAARLDAAATPHQRAVALSAVDHAEDAARRALWALADLDTDDATADRTAGLADAPHRLGTRHRRGRSRRGHHDVLIARHCLVCGIPLGGTSRDRLVCSRECWHETKVRAAGRRSADKLGEPEHFHRAGRRHGRKLRLADMALHLGIAEATFRRWIHTGRYRTHDGRDHWVAYWTIQEP